MNARGRKAEMALMAAEAEVRYFEQRAGVSCKPRKAPTTGPWDLCHYDEDPEEDGYTTECGYVVEGDAIKAFGWWEYCPFCGLEIFIREAWA